MMPLGSISEVRKYLNGVSPGVCTSNIYVYLSREEDLHVLKKRMPVFPGDEVKEVEICSDCISLSIILGEYEATERLIDGCDELNMYIGFTAIRCRPEIYDVDIFFSEILYSRKIDLPEELRFKILKKFKENWIFGTVSCGGLISINQINEISSPRVQAKIMNDYSKHPEYFDYGDFPQNVEKLPAVCFLMKLYKDDPYKLDELMRGRIDLLDIVKIQPSSYQIRICVRMIKEVYRYEWPRKYKADLFAMLIAVYSGIQKVSEEDILYYVMDDEYHNGELQRIKRLRSELAGFIESFQISEDEHAEAMEMIKVLGITAVTYGLDFGKTILGHKPVFYIPGVDTQSTESFFGIRMEYDYDNRYYGTVSRKKISQIRALAESIGRIEYNYQCISDIRDSISEFLRKNIQQLSDSFRILLEKGLVPEEYRDHVISNLKESGVYDYMLSIGMLLLGTAKNME